jgi:hypothetical protein
MCSGIKCFWKPNRDKMDSQRRSIMHAGYCYWFASPFNGIDLVCSRRVQRGRYSLSGPPSLVTASTKRSCRSGVHRSRGLGSRDSTTTPIAAAAAPYPARSISSNMLLMLIPGRRTRVPSAACGPTRQEFRRATATSGMPLATLWLPRTAAYQ